MEQKVGRRCITGNVDEKVDAGDVQYLEGLGVQTYCESGGERRSSKFGKPIFMPRDRDRRIVGLGLNERKKPPISSCLKATRIKQWNDGAPKCVTLCTITKYRVANCIAMPLFCYCGSKRESSKHLSRNGGGGQNRPRSIDLRSTYTAQLCSRSLLSVNDDVSPPRRCHTP